MAELPFFPAGCVQCGSLIVGTRWNLPIFCSPECRSAAIAEGEPGQAEIARRARLIRENADISDLTRGARCHVSLRADLRGGDRRFRLSGIRDGPVRGFE